MPCLDGGGIRAIVQLEVLRAIEQMISPHLPIQNFFDLVVGTGSGGMRVVALSMKDRTVESYINMFCATCDQTYNARLSVPIIGQLPNHFSGGPKYKTRPLYAALKTAFGGEDEFFTLSNKFPDGARVAITSASELAWNLYF